MVKGRSRRLIFLHEGAEARGKPCSAALGAACLPEAAGCRSCSSFPAGRCGTQTSAGRALAHHSQPALTGNRTVRSTSATAAMSPPVSVPSPAGMPGHPGSWQPN